MNNRDFSKLIESIKQAGAIKRGEIPTYRATRLLTVDVQGIRVNLKLTQTAFANLIGVSPRTVQNWEQKRREPDGPAKALLQVAARHPKEVFETLHRTRTPTAKERSKAHA